MSHELNAYNAYTQAFTKLGYWRLACGIEVDFIVNDIQLAIEAKATTKMTADHLKGLGALVNDNPRVKRVGVSLERSSRRTEGGILILSPMSFRDRLATGELF